MLNEKEKTARLSIFSNLFLIILKMIVGLISGSVSLISEAIHSGMDLLASIIAFFSVKISSKPPDQDHPYGHGKYENISGVLEAFLIFVAAIWIIYEAVKKFISGGKIEFIIYGFIVMIISMLVNLYVSKQLYKTAKKYDSIALEADALHLKTDIYTSAGVAIGFLLIYLTGFVWLDPVIAILVALLIIYEAFQLLNNAFSPLVDTQLPQIEVTEINTILKEFLIDYKGISYTRIRTRKSGSQKYLDFILKVPNDMSVKKAHEICDDMEEKINEKFPKIDINIHIEPGN
ncbi:MAG TPA: cation transporter [Bacteroidetes bacterium]|nr:cation transporter [Bacteroidota bacterium]